MTKKKINHENMNPFLKIIHKRVHRFKMNHLQVITGESGSGKSYCALRMAEQLDPTFNIDKVCFSAKEFINAVSNVKRNGEVIILDEMGVALSSRKFQSISNILVNEVIQTFRYKRIICFFVVPDFSFIDVQARKMCHVFSSVQRVGTDYVNMKVNWIIIDRKLGKSYFYNPVVKGKGFGYKISNVKFTGLPSKELYDAYEEKHKREKEELTKRNLKTIELFDNKERSWKETLIEMVEEVRKNPDKFFIDGKVSLSLVCSELDLSINKGRQVVSIIKRTPIEVA